MLKSVFRSKNRLVIATILIFALLFLTRFLWLDKFPAGFFHDEIECVLSSKTYSLFGHDLSGIPFPLSLFRTDTLGRISPIPSILMSPLWHVLPLNQFTARLAFVMINIFTSVVIYFLGLKLFKNNYIAILSSLLFLMNPWSFFISRFAVDASFAIFCYSLAVTLLIYVKGWKLIIPFIFFVLGFFTYAAAKVVFLPLIVVCVAYQLVSKNNKKNFMYLVFLLASLVFFILFIFISKHIPDSILNQRSSELFFLDKTFITNQVNSLRDASIVFPLKNLFVNKITVIARIFISNYLIAFSPQYLFSFGDPVAIQGFYFHGLFYLTDIIFVYFGSIYMYKQKKSELIFLVALILIAPIATASSQNGLSIVNRSFMLLVPLILISAYGLYYVYQYLSKHFPSKIVISGITVWLLVSFTSFLYLYFIQLPVFAQENYKVGERIVAKYAMLEHDHKVTVIVPEPRQTYLEAVFYAPQNIQNKLLKTHQTERNLKEYSVGNITFTDHCPTASSPHMTYIVSSGLEKCKPNKTPTYFILNQKDAGDVFKIYYGSLCDKIDLSRWNTQHLVSDYAVEHMDRTTFCKRWISLPDMH